MGFGTNIIKKIFPQVFICVLFEHKGCILKLLYVKDGKIKNSETKKFKSYDNTLPIEAINFLKKMISKHPFMYLCTLSENISQSIIESCTKEGIQEDGDYIWICIDKKWGAITKKDDIQEVKERFAKVAEPDFLFSPYALLWYAIKQELDSKKRLYILNIKSSVTFMIANEDGVSYGAFFSMLANEIQNIEEIPSKVENHEEDRELDDILAPDEPEAQEISDEVDELDILDELDDMGLEEFDEGDKNDTKEITQGEESLEDETKTRQPDDEPHPEDSFEEFARGVEIISYIKEALSDYYKNPSLKSEFIDEVVIIDDTGLKPETLEYMGDVLLLDMVAKERDVGDMINLIAKEEVENGI